MSGGKHKLSDRFIKTAKPKISKKTDKPYLTRYNDGHGLYLLVRPDGNKSWSFIYIINGKRREMGLGSQSRVSLSQARKKAAAIREQIGDGLNPFEERNKEKAKTFKEVAEIVIADLKPTWTNEKHVYQWERALLVQAEAMHSIPVNEISTEHVLKVLKPIWIATPETGKRLRGRIERVIDYAIARGWRLEANPARWKGHMQSLLPIRKQEKKHHPAMPYSNAPDFMRVLKERNNIPELALAFTILTAARTGETIGAKWEEIDFKNAVWTVPASRMKARRAHLVPISGAAIQILEKLFETRISDFIFPGRNPHKPISNMSMTMALRRLGFEQYSVHGFRSTFRDFAGDNTKFSREVAEAALAHRIGDAVEQAYRRGSAFEKRRKLMETWANYCFSNETSKVVRFSA